MVEFDRRKPEHPQLKAMGHVNDAIMAAEVVAARSLYGVDSIWYYDWAETMKELVAVCNRHVPPGRYLDLCVENSMLARMELDMVVSGYPQQLRSTKTATLESALHYLKLVGQWARTGISIGG